MEVDFIGVGFPKCGTTTIARLLEQHPEICLSVPKEIKYFNTKKSFRHARTYNENSEKGTQWYFNHWKHIKNNQKAGEFSVSYILDPKSAARIKSQFPDVKIIICLRNPAHASFSFYNMLKQYYNHKIEDFEKIIRSTHDFNSDYDYLNKVKPYLEIFDRSQLYFVVLEEFISDAEAELVNLYSFIDVNPFFVPSSLHQKFNQAKKTTIPFLRKFERSFVNRLGGLGFTSLIVWMKRQKIIQFIQKLYLKKPDNYKIDQKDYVFLIDKHRKSLKELGRLIGKDLHFWFGLKK